MIAYLHMSMTYRHLIAEGSSARKKEFLSTTGISHSNGAVSDMAIVTTIDIQSMSHSGAISNNFVHCCIDSASRPSTSSTPTCVSSSGEVGQRMVLDVIAFIVFEAIIFLPYTESLLDVFNECDFDLHKILVNRLESRM